MFNIWEVRYAAPERATLTVQRSLRLVVSKHCTNVKQSCAQFRAIACSVTFRVGDICSVVVQYHPESDHGYALRVEGSSASTCLASPKRLASDFELG